MAHAPRGEEREKGSKKHMTPSRNISFIAMYCLAMVQPSPDLLTRIALNRLTTRRPA